MSLILSLALLLVTPTANAINGTITVKAGSLRVQRADDGMKVHFYPGSYKTQISFDGRDLHFGIERKDIRTDAKLTMPSGTHIPDNGPVEIDGFKTGQTFAARGNVSTVRQDSEPYRENESCVYYRQEWVCHGYGHNYHCDWEQIAVQGYRPVEYYFQTKTVTLSLNLDSRNGGAATFDGREVNRNKIYTYQGQCY